MAQTWQRRLRIRVSLWDGASLRGESPQKLVDDFFVFELGLRNGAFLGLGDLTADGKAELIVGGGPNGGPRVRAFDATVLLTGQFDTTDPNEAQIANFFAGDPENRGGVRVSVKELDGDSRADILVGLGTGAGSRVTAYAGTSVVAEAEPTELFAFDAFDAPPTGGIYVGGGTLLSESKRRE